MHTFYFKYLIDAGDCAMFKNNYINSYIFHVMWCVSDAVYKGLITCLNMLCECSEDCAGLSMGSAETKVKEKGFGSTRMGEKPFLYLEPQSILWDKGVELEAGETSVKWMGYRGGMSQGTRLCQGSHWGGGFPPLS